jgi:hypothetical protein
MTVCEMCDCEIEGLFESIWSLHSSGFVQGSDFGHYILLLAHIIDLSKDLGDDFVEIVNPFLDFIFGQDCIEKYSGLSLVSSIVKKRPSLLGDILPRVSGILGESLSFANDDVQCQGLGFVENIAKHFGSASLPFVSGSFDFVVQMIEEGTPGTRVYCTSLRTGSIIIKFCEDDTLLHAIEGACMS